jgi:nitrite reductase/ring-hydroxylating ferredoxin subunit
LFRDLASVDDLLPGGMRAYTVEDKELVLCNDGGRFYAFQRRCGHMNDPLEMGTANGFVITCPLHSVQFDVTTGKALSPPVPAYSMWEQAIPETGDNFTRWITLLMEHVKTCDLKTYPVRVEGGRISVDL